jgi:hypothetical protein
MAICSGTIPVDPKVARTVGMRSQFERSERSARPDPGGFNRDVISSLQEGVRRRPAGVGESTAHVMLANSRNPCLEHESTLDRSRQTGCAKPPNDAVHRTLSLKAERHLHILEGAAKLIAERGVPLGFNRRSGRSRQRERAGGLSALREQSSAPVCATSQSYGRAVTSGVTLHWLILTN